ncbi:DUF664 domain-containing protein [Streptomyces californicus]|uniref:mycothiol transferase n=1 Tax=Streptomyces californicus TaxID=67351 RepID=UPI0036894315
MTRIDDTPPAWDERTQLTTFLDYARGATRAKCEGVCEETARHNGHLDILRELLDGATARPERRPGRGSEPSA